MYQHYKDCEEAFADGKNIKELMEHNAHLGEKHKYADAGIFLYRKRDKDQAYSKTSIHDVGHVATIMRAYGHQRDIRWNVNGLNGMEVELERYWITDNINDTENMLKDLSKVWVIWCYTDDEWGHELDENLNVVSRWLPDTA